MGISYATRRFFIEIKLIWWLSIHRSHVARATLTCVCSAIKLSTGVFDSNPSLTPRPDLSEILTNFCAKLIISNDIILSALRAGPRIIFVNFPKCWARGYFEGGESNPSVPSVDFSRFPSFELSRVKTRRFLSNTGAFSIGPSHFAMRLRAQNPRV